MAAIHECPECDEPLVAMTSNRNMNEVVMVCPIGCDYERPLDPDDPVDDDRLTTASERYWMPRWNGE